MSQERAVSDVLRDILRRFQEIVRSEVRLAKVEIKGDARHAAASAVWIAAGVVGALSAWAFLLWPVAFAPSTRMSMWAATLVVALVLACVASIRGWRHSENEADPSHPGANDRLDQGERRMDQTPSEIETDIERTRERLGSHLVELEQKVEAATDWREHFRTRPQVFLGAAFVGGASLPFVLHGQHPRTVSDDAKVRRFAHNPVLRRRR